ncbi:MAG: protein phosphatase CheZ [Deltaproteobacteria bacterium]|nr:protein phosphatase CheZ [Deltaproteobacteria bacterium]MBZ0219272.1 protein phosphatase CheZ [Deltaproteobacteria bacterium]
MTQREWSGVMNKIREELTGLAKFIDKTRQGIDTIETTVKMGSEQFPEASTQLSSVTGDLETAANKIMNIVEGLMAEQDKAGTALKSLSEWTVAPGADPGKGAALISELQMINAKSKGEMVELFALMSFQDLTGQKLAKVIKSLSVVEQKIVDVAMSFGFEDTGAAAKASEPRKPKEAPASQDMVDRLLKEIGS